MRKLLLTASLAAMVPFGAALAQVSVPTNAPAGATEIDTTTVVETPEGEYRPLATHEGHVVANVDPAPASAPVPPVKYVPASEAQPDAAPGPDGVLRQWGPQQAVVETAPAPAGSYPLCNAQRQDSCKNPDPSKELPYYPGEDRPGA